MTPIALYLAEQLENYRGVPLDALLLMNNAADELRSQYAKISDLEAKLVAKEK